MTIEPYSRKEPVIGIHYVNVTLTTNYPEVWKTILANANTSGTNATVTDNKIYINSTKKDNRDYRIQENRKENKVPPVVEMDFAKLEEL